MQHYVDPLSVEIRCENIYSSKKLREILTRDGQIVPLLVRKDEKPNGNVVFYVDDYRQAERLYALRQLEWPTVLVEDTWDKEDLW